MPKNKELLQQVAEKTPEKIKEAEEAPSEAE